MDFVKKISNLQEKTKILKAKKENQILAKKLMAGGKFFTFMVMTIFISQITMSANGLPFYDKLELGLKIMKVVGSVVAILSFFGGLYFMNDGQRDAVKKAVWFAIIGIVTANIQWFADEFGLMAGALF